MTESTQELALRVARTIKLGQFDLTAFIYETALIEFAQALLAESENKQAAKHWQVTSPQGTFTFDDERQAEAYASQWDVTGPFAGQGVATVKSATDTLANNDQATTSQVGKALEILHMIVREIPKTMGEANLPLLKEDIESAISSLSTATPSTPEWFDQPFIADALASFGMKTPTPRQYGEVIANRYRARIAELEAEAKEPFSASPYVSRLNPETLQLVRRFAEAMALKLLAAEKKYGYSSHWASPEWMDECKALLLEHLNKGDPVDVANYCAFLWFHKEKTPSVPRFTPEQIQAAEQQAQEFSQDLAQNEAKEPFTPLSAQDNPLENKAFEMVISQFIPNVPPREREWLVRFARKIWDARARRGAAPQKQAPHPALSDQQLAVLHHALTSYAASSRRLAEEMKARKPEIAEAFFEEAQEAEALNQQLCLTPSSSNPWKAR